MKNYHFELTKLLDIWKENKRGCDWEDSIQVVVDETDKRRAISKIWRVLMTEGNALHLEFQFADEIMGAPDA